MDDKQFASDHPHWWQPRRLLPNAQSPIDMIRRSHERLGISADVLIRPSRVDDARLIVNPLQLQESFVIQRSILVLGCPKCKR
jgi:hypothetical protein